MASWDWQHDDSRFIHDDYMHDSPAVNLERAKQELEDQLERPYGSNWKAPAYPKEMSAAEWYALERTCKCGYELQAKDELCCPVCATVYRDAA